MISLRYGFLCDYAASDSNEKPTIVGIHDVYKTNVPSGVPIRLPKHYVHARLEGSGDVAPRNLATLRLIDADANTITQLDWPLELVSRGEGLGLFAHVHVHVDQHLVVPDYGQYNWVIMVNGIRIGEIPFVVMQLQVQNERAPTT